MKKILFVLLSVFCFSITANAQQKDKKNNKETVVLDVSMHCEKCQKKIEKNIPFEKGVSGLKVDLPNDKVTVEFNSAKTSIEKLQKAFEKLGYAATLPATDDSEKSVEKVIE